MPDQPGGFDQLFAAVLDIALSAAAILLTTCSALVTLCR
jgi:hypothetical protein